MARRSEGDPIAHASIDGWRIAPRLGVVLPARGTPGWSDAAMWSALLRAWGFPFESIGSSDHVSTALTTLIVPASLAGSVTTGATVLAVGSGRPAGDVLRFEPSADALTASTLEDAVDSAAGALEAAAPAGLVAIARWPFGRRAALVVDGDVDHPTGVDPECSRYVAPAIETAKRAGFPAYGIFVAGANVEAEPSSFPPGAEYYNHSFSHPYSHWNDHPWESLDDAEIETEITRCRSAFERELGGDDHAMFRLPHFQLEASDRTYTILDRLGYLADSSIGGNISITGGLPFHPAIEPWSDRLEDSPFARTDPEQARTRALLQVPISTDPTDPAFPPGAEYYNHSFSHPYSHWNDRPWESLDDAEMETEITRCRSALERELGADDHAMFRLPHFQLEASDRTYAILDRMGYLADSSIGGNVSVTGGLPFHPAIEPWSVRPEDAAFARTDPEQARTRALLQVPISTDPTDPAFPHGCCSYNTLGEGVRTRTADPAAYEGVLQEVLDRAVARRSLAHLFIDPPDAGYGRLPGDLADYAAGVERWMRRAVGRSDLSVLSLAGLVSWWMQREAAVERLRWRVENGRLRISLPDAPAGAALSVLAPVEVGGGWSTVALESEAA